MFAGWQSLIRTFVNHPQTISGKEKVLPVIADSRTRFWPASGWDVGVVGFPEREEILYLRRMCWSTVNAWRFSMILGRHPLRWSASAKR
jgi:hypothetical protein